MTLSLQTPPARSTIFIHHPELGTATLEELVRPDQGQFPGHSGSIRRLLKGTATQEDLDLIALDTRSSAALLHHLACSRDPDYRAAAALSGRLGPKDNRKLAADPSVMTRFIHARMAESLGPAECEAILLDDCQVRRAAIQNPHVPEEVVRACLHDPDVRVVACILMWDLIELTFADLVVLASREDVAWIKGGLERLCELLARCVQQQLVSVEDCVSLAASKHRAVREMVQQIVGNHRLARVGP